MGADKDGDKSLLLNLPNEKPSVYATDSSKFEKDLNYFHVMSHTEPHAIRRKLILEKFPEMAKLFEKREPFVTLFCVGVIHIVQLLIVKNIFNNDYSWTTVLITALVIGAVFNHGLFVLYHDITHFNCFKSIFLNQITAIFCNLPQIIPSAIGFGRYHKDHHSYMGHPIDDPDIPTQTEIKFLKKRITRLFYVILLPLFYGLRPYFKAPKPLNRMELLNIVACFSYAYCIYYFFGIKAVVYLFSSTWFGLSINPVSAHVIAEHYEFVKGQDTYSYYGYLNYLNFNMGYHIEHHDFPNIPWYKLPLVKKIAPEFYDNLPQIDSYVKVMFKYIFDGDIGPWSRIALEGEKNK
jgi:sphingolipid delta-4 desaturase